ncbi:type II secretion system protein GspC [Stagnimonas aquatica]|uniref:Type II secretion system protein GspC n=1 Tax=Stagnimonas aquatica TaxID=2689987 RepID=A0A3N0V8V5_9GAMM|nr:type II secretion system protein GspC [Stagnimonas aquatica]ROH89159.1 type II secretion system protein GspC [Stagnimonas aquatica]
MTATSLPKLPPALANVLARARLLYQRHGQRLPPLAVLLLSLLIAWQLASLVWLAVPTPEAARWKPAPAYVDPTPPKPAVNNDGLASSHLFGEYRAGAVSDAASLANAPDTQLNFTLLGILAGSSDAESLALISREGGDEAPFRIGDDVSPGVNLQAIFPDRVILSRNGRLETLRLDKDAPSNAPLLNAVAQGDSQEGTPAAAEMLSQIRQQVMTDPSKAASFIRVQPIAGESGVRGYRVYPGPERGAFNAAGLKPGDVVTAINGTPLNDPGQALQLLQSLSTASSLNLAVERNGATQSVNLSVNP